MRSAASRASALPCSGDGGEERGGSGLGLSRGAAQRVAGAVLGHAAGVGGRGAQGFVVSEAWPATAAVTPCGVMYALVGLASGAAGRCGANTATRPHIGALRPAKTLCLPGARRPQASVCAVWRVCWREKEKTREGQASVCDFWPCRPTGHARSSNTWSSVRGRLAPLPAAKALFAVPRLRLARRARAVPVCVAPAASPVVSVGDPCCLLKARALRVLCCRDPAVSGCLQGRACG
jgi:hypothetical protein